MTNLPTPFFCKHIDRIIDMDNNNSLDLKKFLIYNLKVIPPSGFSKRKVLILTSKIDLEMDLVGIELLQRGIDYIRFDIESIPSNTKVITEINNFSDTFFKIVVDEESFSVNEISLVIFRLFDIHMLTAYENPLFQEYFIQQWSNIILSLEKKFQCLWINKYEDIMRASDRIHQLSIAKENHLKIPNTLITNDPVKANEFYLSCNKDIVIKVLNHHGVIINNKRYEMYTREIRNDENIDFSSLIVSPCILQERIQKNKEMRITVFGEKIVAVQIDNPIGELNSDIHRGIISLLPKKECEIDDKLKNNCLSMMKSLNLIYCTFDFAINEKGEAVFLEINSIGGWQWLESETGISFAPYMADLVEEKTSI